VCMIAKVFLRTMVGAPIGFMLYRRRETLGGYNEKGYIDGIRSDPYRSDQIVYNTCTSS
jgi:hypothetical protein